MSEFHEEIIKQIKECGQSLIDRAEAMVPKDIPLISDYHIRIKLGINCEYAPTIEYEVNYIPEGFVKRMDGVDNGHE